MALVFDSATAAFLDQAYEGRDFRARRQANLDLLDPREGEVIVDIGCGAGHLDEELARAGVQVIGVDPSEAMLDSARARCAGFANAEFRTGRADALPLAAGEADAAVSVQVFEYLDDIPAALAEAARVLRPGGRLVVGDLHFGTLVWPADDPARHDRIAEIWNRHFATGTAPETLRAAMTGAGFTDLGIATQTTTDIALRQDGLARMMLLLMSRYAAQAGEEALADGWRADHERRAREGRFFFSLSHFVLRGLRA